MDNIIERDIPCSLMMSAGNKAAYTHLSASSADGKDSSRPLAQ